MLHRENKKPLLHPQRYENDHSNQFIEFISKDMVVRSNKNSKSKLQNNQTHIFINHPKNNSQHHPVQIYSNQVIRQRRGASILRNHSKAKCGESMGKFRKDVIKDNSLNFYDGFKDPKAQKKDAQSEKNIIGLQDGIECQEIHYQMVKLHQNIKKMHNNNEQ